MLNDAWADRQRAPGGGLTDGHRQWLDQIARQIANSVHIEPENFENGWFADRGQLVKAHQLFGDRLMPLLDELDLELTA